MDAEDIDLDTCKSGDEWGRAITGMNAYIFTNPVTSLWKKANQRSRSSEVMISISTTQWLETV